jgi:hypothetical protein
MEGKLLFPIFYYKFQIQLFNSNLYSYFKFQIFQMSQLKSNVNINYTILNFTILFSFPFLTLTIIDFITNFSSHSLIPKAL